MFAAGTRHFSNTSSTVGEPRMPIFFSSFPTLKPGVPFSTTNALMPLAPLVGIGYGEHRHDVGDAALCDPDLRAVEYVVVAVARARVRIEPAASEPRAGFGQRVGGDPLAAGELRE